MAGAGNDNPEGPVHAKTMISSQRAARLKTLLDPFVERFDAERRIEGDPVELVRRYEDPADQEIAGLLASCFAYGKVGIFKPRVRRLLDQMGPSPRAFLETFEPRRDAPSLAWFAYRFHGPGDLGALLCGAQAILREEGSLGRYLARELRARGALREALSAFSDRIRRQGLADAAPFGPPRALEHLLPDPLRGSASKRLLLYLRWMVRRDSVDLGSWEGLLPRRTLVVPLDTHLFRIARLLGLSRRRDASWRTAEEITASLARLDPEDPVRYDFALCHLGMSGMCPLRRARPRCLACPLRDECHAGRAFRSADARGASRR